jgi:DNA-binding transcriptional MerR regulator
MRISQLAERSGVPATTLRFYESSGLLPSARSAAGYRLYGDDAVARLAFIGAAKHLGLALEEVAELLAVWESGACAEVKANLRPRIAQRIGEARARSAQLAAFTTTLRRALEHLDALPDRATPCDPECGFLRPADPGPVPLPLDRRARVPQRWRGAPVACSLSPDELGERRGRWHGLLAGARRQDIADGVRLTLPVGRATDITELAAAEQRCCPFFDFRLHLDGPEVRLEIRAPREAAGLLAELLP